MDIRDYTPGDEIKITELFESVFGKPMSVEYWNWRFKNNPSHKYAIKLMWDDQTLVGHYAVSPVVLDIDHTQQLTGLSMTTMTHSSYTGLGVFQQLAESLYKDMQTRHGMVAVWGFPNNNSHRGFIKNLSWKDVGVLPMMTCDITLLSPKLSDTVTTITAFNETHHQAQISFFDDYRVKVRKDSGYLNWRYVDNPVNKYTIWDINDGVDGYVVVKEFGVSGKKQLDIIEWCVAKNERITKSVLQHLAGSYTDGYQQLNIWMPLHDERHLYFEKLGFINNLPVTYMGIRSFQLPDMEQDKNWWIQMGDSDVY